VSESSSVEGKAENLDLLKFENQAAPLNVTCKTQKHYFAAKNAKDAKGKTQKLFFAFFAFFAAESFFLFNFLFVLIRG